MDSDGTVTMTIHQVNGDGAGRTLIPVSKRTILTVLRSAYACGVSADGTGASFVAMTVSTNVSHSTSCCKLVPMTRRQVPGTRSNSNAKATDFPLVAAVAPGTTCTGAGGTCLVRCMNAARAGPFGRGLI